MRWTTTPSPNVLPRAADDEATAQALSSVLPVVLEQADYEQVYSDAWWRKLKQGTGVTGIFWDPAARGGLGDIAVRSVNLLMLYWEPGVQDIQDVAGLCSRLSLEDTARLTAQYPQLAGHAAGVVDVPRYIHEDGQTTANKSVVVDWYYKRPDENGRLRAALLQVLQRRGAVRQPERPGAGGARACTTTASTPLCSTRCSWRRIPPPGSATST